MTTTLQNSELILSVLAEAIEALTDITIMEHFDYMARNGSESAWVQSTVTSDIIGIERKDYSAKKRPSGFILFVEGENYLFYFDLARYIQRAENITVDDIIPAIEKALEWDLKPVE